MSHSLLGDVWKIQSINFKEKLVLLKLVDYLHPDHLNDIYPSITTLCVQTRLGETCVRKCLNSLQEKEFTTLVKDATSKFPKIWKINVEIIKREAELGVRAANLKTKKTGVRAANLRGARGEPKSLDKSLEKINTTYLKKEELPSNRSNFENSSPEQKPMSGEIDLLGSGKIIPEKTPTPKNEQSSQEEKAVGTSSSSPLKAEDVKTPKKYKAKGKMSKPKSEKVVKTKINPEMELTPELRKMALDVRVDGKGLKQGYVETQFKIFKNKYVANQRKEERWDLKWEGWCINAVSWDEYSKISMVNPTRTTVSDKPAEKELPIDSSFEEFLNSNPHVKKEYFRGATLERGEKVIIWHSDENKASYIDQVYCVEFRGYFGTDVRVKVLSEDVKKPSPAQPIQIQPTSAQPIELPIDDFNVCLEKMRMLAIAKLAEIEDEEERFMKWNRLERDIKYVKNTYRINHDVLNIGLIAQKCGLHGLSGGNP